MKKGLFIIITLLLMVGVVVGAGKMDNYKLKVGGKYYDIQRSEDNRGWIFYESGYQLQIQQEGADLKNYKTAAQSAQMDNLKVYSGDGLEPIVNFINDNKGEKEIFFSQEVEVADDYDIVEFENNQWYVGKKKLLTIDYNRVKGDVVDASDFNEENIDYEETYSESRIKKAINTVVSMAKEGDDVVENAKNVVTGGDVEEPIEDSEELAEVEESVESEPMHVPGITPNENRGLTTQEYIDERVAALLLNGDIDGAVHAIEDADLNKPYKTQLRDGVSEMILQSLKKQGATDEQIEEIKQKLSKEENYKLSSFIAGEATDYFASISDSTEYCQVRLA